MIKKILTFPHPVLTTKCHPVDTQDFPPGLRVTHQVVEDLLHTATHNYDRCLGLSANQLGYNLRIFVMRQEGGPFFHVVNPVIVARMGGIKRMKEGCLSRVDFEGNFLPGIPVRRAKHIKVECHTFHWKGYTVHGIKGERHVEGPCFRKETFELKGIDARVFQHELDHLNGVEI